MDFDLNSIVPEGWEAVDYRIPTTGEAYLATSGSETPYAQVRQDGNSSSTSSIILKRKRWRAEPGDSYFYFTNELDVGLTCEDGMTADDTMHEIGNYFQTKKEAEAAAKKIRALLKAEAG